MIFTQLWSPCTVAAIHHVPVPGQVGEDGDEGGDGDDHEERGHAEPLCVADRIRRGTVKALIGSVWVGSVHEELLLTLT